MWFCCKLKIPLPDPLPWAIFPAPGSETLKSGPPAGRSGSALGLNLRPSPTGSRAGIESLSTRASPIERWKHKHAKWRWLVQRCYYIYTLQMTRILSFLECQRNDNKNIPGPPRHPFHRSVKEGKEGGQQQQLFWMPEWPILLPFNSSCLLWMRPPAARQQRQLFLERREKRVDWDISLARGLFAFYDKGCKNRFLCLEENIIRNLSRIMQFLATGMRAISLLQFCALF